jgi:hypothetical protein
MTRDLTKKCKNCGKELELWEWNSILSYQSGDVSRDEIGYQGADIYCDECYKERTKCLK